MKRILKIALHWQILIAFVLALILGVLFPTKYVIPEHIVQSNEFTNYTYVQKSGIKQNTNVVFSTQTELIQFLQGLEFNNTEINSILEHSYSNPVISKVSWMGDIFIRALKMIIIPLILTSIISGIINIGGAGNLGRIGLKTFGYYLTTSIFAIVTGLFFVNVFKPGVGIDIGIQSAPNFDTSKSLSDTLFEIIPTNVFQSLSTGHMLSIIFFALLFGFFITKVSIKHKKFLENLFNAGFEVMMKITMFIIKFAPIGIFGIVSKIIADQSDLGALAKNMGFYMLVVLMGLAVHAFVTLPLLVKFVGKAKPFKHFTCMATPLLTAFSTSSSSATLPLTINAVENNSGVSNKISSFTLPLGATINMDGTALYEIVVAMFIAQALGYDISIGQQLVAVFTALLASIGAAGIPMAGLVMISVVLTALGLPLDAIGLVLAVDRILDMFRTAVNVWSDSCGAVIIAKSEGEKLKV